jgi:hypothetical protein
VVAVVVVTHLPQVAVGEAEELTLRLLTWLLSKVQPTLSFQVEQELVMVW